MIITMKNWTFRLKQQILIPGNMITINTEFPYVKNFF